MISIIAHKAVSFAPTSCAFCEKDHSYLMVDDVRFSTCEHCGYCIAEHRIARTPGIMTIPTPLRWNEFQERMRVWVEKNMKTIS